MLRPGELEWGEFLILLRGLSGESRLAALCNAYYQHRDGANDGRALMREEEWDGWMLRMRQAAEGNQ